jgi:ferritin-like metal-binding protein YciE
VAELNARDTKLVQYLNEAFTKEKQLEQALEAHIGMTTLAPYRKRLQQHLSETKRHAREVERRIKRIGGDTNGGNVVQEAAGVVQEVAARGAALAQGPIHAVRGTSEQETQLKNARTEFKEEAEEIGTYTMIQNLAEKVGDRDTASLAKAILREEKRMAGFLEKLIPRLTSAVAQAEIPAKERNGGRRRTTTRRSTSGSRAGTSRAGSRSGTTRASGTRSRSGSGATKRASGSSSASKRSGSRSASSRSRSSVRSGSASTRRTTAKRASGSRSSGSRASGSRSTGGRSSSARKTTGRTSSRKSSR